MGYINYIKYNNNIMFKKFLANMALAALLVTTTATGVMAANVSGTKILKL